MYNTYGVSQCPFYSGNQGYSSESVCHVCTGHPFYPGKPLYSQAYNPYYMMIPNTMHQMIPQMNPQQFPCQYGPEAGKAMNNGNTGSKDYGPDPFTVNIREAATQNKYFRTALWTGKHLQLTLMSIGVGEDIGLEIHPELDQFIRIEEGRGIVKMGDSRDRLDYQRMVSDDCAFIIPAGKWHNLINTGNTPIKLYSIYAPPQHPHGTIHETKADAMAAEHHH
jgi:mannose-6-phosphate isomerase-like protein (cupin superfamily)